MLLLVEDEVGQHFGIQAKHSCHPLDFTCMIGTGCCWSLACHN